MEKSFEQEGSCCRWTQSEENSGEGKKSSRWGGGVHMRAVHKPESPIEGLPGRETGVVCPYNDVDRLKLAAQSRWRESEVYRTRVPAYNV